MPSFIHTIKGGMFFRVSNNNNNRRLVTLAEHTSDHGRVSGLLLLVKVFHTTLHANNSSRNGKQLGKQITKQKVSQLIVI